VRTGENGMSALLGGKLEDVLERLTELGLDPANRNGAGQVVAAASCSALEQLAAQPSEAGTGDRAGRGRRVPHRFMEPAEEALRGYAEKLEFADPALKLLSNADGAVVATERTCAAGWSHRSRSRCGWDQCMATLAELGVTAVVELAPAGYPHRARQARRSRAPGRSR